MWTDEMYQRLLEIRATNVSNGETAEILNDEFGTKLTANAVTKKFNRGKRKSGKVGSPNNMQPSDSIKQNIKYNEDETIKHVDLDVKLVFKTKTDKTPQQVMELKGYNPDEWKLIDVTDNDWSMTNGDGDQYWNYQCKIRIAPKLQEVNYEKLIESIIKHKTPYKPRVSILIPSDSYLVNPSFDTHLDGDRLEFYRKSLDETNYIIGSKPRKESLLILGGDIADVDSVNNTTTRGTQLETVNIENMWDELEEYYESILETMITHSETVKVMSLVGNHDNTVGYLFARQLQRAYSKYSNVLFDVTLKQRKATMLGNNMIGGVHGDKAHKNYPQLFATEFAEYWAKASNREVYSGHLHTEVTKDHGGIIQRQVGSAVPVNKWGDDNGFVMSSKKFQLVEYDSNQTKCVMYV